MTWASLEETDPKTGLILRARQRLANLMNQTGYPDARCEAVPSMYSAKYEILRFAKEHQADLIVVGSHARRGLERLLGSTAAGVVHGAVCDVLTVHVAYVVGDIGATIYPS
jgi:universal stress protein A